MFGRIEIKYANKVSNNNNKKRAMMMMTKQFY